MADEDMTTIHEDMTTISVTRRVRWELVTLKERWSKKTINEVVEQMLEHFMKGIIERRVYDNSNKSPEA